MWVEVENEIIYKSPDEKFYIGIDFSPNFSSGEYIDASNVSITAVEKGTGQDATDVIMDAATIQVQDGTKLIVNIQGGEEGKWYVITFKITTTLGNVFEEEREIVVK